MYYTKTPLDNSKVKIMLITYICTTTTVTIVFQYIPGLAKVKRLSLDFLWVYVYWEKTGHFINRPVKLRWSLGKIRGSKSTTVLLSGAKRVYKLVSRYLGVYVTHTIANLKDAAVIEQTYRFTRLDLEHRWAWHQGFMEMVVIIGTFKGVSDGRPAWSLWCDV